jgi:Flp pilus assembly protein TadG
MALVAPVFLLLVMGALQFAHVMFLRHEIYAAAQQICRQLALGADTAATATSALRAELQRIGVTGTLEVVAPTPTTDASVSVRVPLAPLLWTDLFRPMVGDAAMQLRVVYRSSSRTG